MARFLIEVSHENSKQACDEAIKIFKNTGSHFLTNADWGCLDDVHKSWIIIEVDDKEAALMIVPPQLRENAIAITLDKFALDTVGEAIKQHKD